MPEQQTIKNISEFKDKTLLIVDDDNPFRERLARAMEKKGFSVTQAIMILIGFSALFGLTAIMAFRIINFLGFSILLSIFLTYILLK